MIVLPLGRDFTLSRDKGKKRVNTNRVHATLPYEYDTGGSKSQAALAYNCLSID